VESEKFEITEVLVYPNPLMKGSNSLYFRLNVSETPDSIGLKIYTVSFRAIRHIEWTTGIARGDNVLQVPLRELAGAASGTYYYVITAENNNGGRARSKAGSFIILR
jgi:hypothetical protein